MSRSRLMAVAVAGSAIIGGAFYATRRPEKQSPEELRRNKADRARDLGLGSAGMGHNQVTGGPEAGAAPSRPDETDRMRPVHTTASSKDKLPSGGAGGDERRSSQEGYSDNAEKQHPGLKTPSSDSASQMSSGNLFGDEKSKARRVEESEHHNTRGYSAMGSEVPSKKKSGMSN
ncbi:uncharacterized protein CPUR_01222 [Claviceps purpurea 20.1]|uniref:Uncharacterized protein n=1 Tax=Claviceps purpurea (strain 20.1) TaxID=1111077 RepID=M1W699_CLAP2|nr:uncharacterized protein CPUR_01222 [Claviceps purpurea 20.1]